MHALEGINTKTKITNVSLKNQPVIVHKLAVWCVHLDILFLKIRVFNVKICYVRDVQIITNLKNVRVAIMVTI